MPIRNSRLSEVLDLDNIDISYRKIHTIFVGIRHEIIDRYRHIQYYKQLRFKACNLFQAEKVHFLYTLVAGGRWTWRIRAVDVYLHQSP
jgi:hypothetical protein